jgi:hypothetical protein
MRIRIRIHNMRIHNMRIDNVRIRMRIRMRRFCRLSNRLCINVEKIGEKTATGYSLSLY